MSSGISVPDSDRHPNRKITCKCWEQMVLQRQSVFACLPPEGSHRNGLSRPAPAVHTPTATDSPRAVLAPFPPPPHQDYVPTYVIVLSCCRLPAGALKPWAWQALCSLSTHVLLCGDFQGYLLPLALKHDLGRVSLSLAVASMVSAGSAPWRVLVHGGWPGLGWQ